MKQIAALFLSLTLLVSASAQADTVLERKIKLRGTPNFLKVDLATTKKVVFWSPSSGNMSSNLSVYARLPSDAKLTAKAAFVQKSYEKTLSDKKFHYDVDLLTISKRDKKHSQCLPISVEESDAGVSVEDFPAISDPACDAVGTKTLQTMADSLSQAYGGDWGIGNACAFFIQSIGGSPDFGNVCDYISEEELALFGLQCIDEEEEQAESEYTETPALASKVKRKIAPRAATTEIVQLYALMEKDACLSASKPEYLVMFEIDLSRVDATQYPSGVEMTFTAKESKLSKGKESAIKPESEGRYQPKPIVMMNYLGDTCGNRIDVISWNKYKPVGSTPLTVYGLLSYKGMVLSLALVDRVLTGGHATFQLSTKREAYGTCFNLQRKRQNKNGYPR